MVWAKLETWDELNAITLFHVIGFCLEVFKTSSGIRSWSYPDFAYTKVLGVPHASLHRRLPLVSRRVRARPLRADVRGVPATSGGTRR